MREIELADYIVRVVVLQYLIDNYAATFVIVIFCYYFINQFNRLRWLLYFRLRRGVR